VSVDLELPEVKAAIAAETAKLVEAEVKGLKKKNEELLDEVKDVKKRFEGIDPKEYQELKIAKREAEDKDGDPVKLRERIEGEYQPKLTKAEQERDDALKKLNSTIIENQLTAALVEGGVAKEFLRAVKADFASTRKVEVNGDGVTIDGKSVGDFVKAWATDEGKSFIAAPHNSGGGSQGGGGGGAAVNKKLSEMTRDEKAALQQEIGLDAYKQKVNNERLAK
jgi:FtsZ-binding cell division protein ZapB